MADNNVTTLVLLLVQCQQSNSPYNIHKMDILGETKLVFDIVDKKINLVLLPYSVFGAYVVADVSAAALDEPYLLL